jgi:hypothetical protein
MICLAADSEKTNKKDVTNHGCGTQKKIDSSQKRAAASFV